MPLGRRDPQLSNSMRERLALNIMVLVGRAFRDPQRTLNIQTLSEEMKIPSLTLWPLAAELEKNALLTTNEKDELLPGRDVARIRLQDIIEVVRSQGETGSFQEPHWESHVDGLGQKLDDAVSATIGEVTLSDLLDEVEKSGSSGSAAGDGHPVDED
jgi:DNA-binding IscR family transcriptional regulator